MGINSHQGQSPRSHNHQTQMNGLSNHGGSFEVSGRLGAATELEFECSYLTGFRSHSSGSGCSSYVGSPGSVSVAMVGSNSHLLQRSTDKRDLSRGGSYSLLGPLEDSDDCLVPRACSVGDLESESSYMARRWGAESPISVSTENSMIIEGMMRTTKYSPEEKRERIERYRSKRNQRNFNRKIQYTCRKSLADSRPRVKGRFVRNDEVSAKTTAAMTENGSGYDSNYVMNDQCSSSYYQHESMEYEESEENSWINNLLDYSFSYR